MKNYAVLTCGDHGFRYFLYKSFNAALNSLGKWCNNNVSIVGLIYDISKKNIIVVSDNMYDNDDILKDDFEKWSDYCIHCLMLHFHLNYK